MRTTQYLLTLLFLTGLCSLNLAAFAQQAPQGVVFFEGTWEELLAKAKAEKRPIFVDVYTTWCGPCKVMDKKTFADGSVGSYANKHFIAYKLNAEKGQGPALAQKFRVGGYPTVLFLDENGKLLGRSVGLLYPDDFILQLEGYKERAEQRSDGMKMATPAQKAKLGKLFEKQ